ncbi:PilZ domain-containing protein, partial [Sphingomonas solaris]
MPDRSTAPSHDHEPAPIVPRAQRGSVLLIATIEHDGKQEPTRHRVRDLSTGGVRIDNALVLRVGDTVTVSIGAVHALAATVRWIRDGLAGLAFAAAIDPEQARK